MLRFLGTVAALTTLALSPAMAQASARVGPVEFGDVFPSAQLQNFNAGAGGVAGIDTSRVIGKRPVVLFYWIAGNPTADSAFLELQALADEIGPAKLVLYGVATERPGLGREQIVQRLRELKIHVPVLNDVGFKIGEQLQVRQVPSISILDSEGKLRLANAGSLRQPLEYKLDIQGAIERVSSGATLGTYGQMPRWYPVKELVGKQCPDFEAPVLGNGEITRWSTMIDPEKVNVLMFWSVDCPHCREALPELNEWLKSNPDGINIVGAASINDEANRVKTQEFCEGKQFVFTNLVDENRQIMDQFGVVSTPTFVIMGPDGVIDSVHLSGESGLEEKLEAKMKELLGAGETSGT